MLFKTNTKGHNHPSIRLLSKSKTQLLNKRKQKVAFSPGTAYSPEIQSYRTWWGAASPILNDTPVVVRPITELEQGMHIHIYIYIIYILYIYIYFNTELLDGKQGHQEETHRPTHRFRRLFLDLLSMGWRGCASAMGAIKVPPSCSSPKIMCQSIYAILICSRGVFISNSKLRNCVIVAIECFLQQLIDAVQWPECIDVPWWSIVACRLNLRGPSLTVVSIGMGHLSSVILLLMYLNRLTKRSRYFGGCNI